MNFVQSIYNIFKRPKKFYSLLRASIVYYLGKREAYSKFQQTGRRYYCIYDPNDNSLVSLTYKAYKGRGDSYQYLRRRGRIAPLTEQKFKEGAFYYTPSKNGATEMPDIKQHEMLELLRLKMFHLQHKKKGSKHVVH